MPEPEKKTRVGKFAVAAAAVLTVMVNCSNFVLNAQKTELSRAGYEVAWWCGTGGAMLIFVSSVMLLCTLLVRGQKVLENDRLARWLCYLAVGVLISTGLTMSAWVIIQVGWFVCVLVEIAVLGQLIFTVFIIRRCIHDRHGKK